MAPNFKMRALILLVSIVIQFNFNWTPIECFPNVVSSYSSNQLVTTHHQDLYGSPTANSYHRRRPLFNSAITMYRLPPQPDICQEFIQSYYMDDAATLNRNLESHRRRGKSNVLYTFTTPNFPFDYPELIDCIKVIKAPDDNYRITLDFRGLFRMEPSPGCENDYLEVRDGEYGFSPLIGRFCTDSFDLPAIYSTGPWMWLRLHTDFNINKVGFQAVYYFDPIPRDQRDRNLCKKQGVLKTVFDVDRPIKIGRDNLVARWLGNVEDQIRRKSPIVNLTRPINFILDIRSRRPNSTLVVNLSEFRFRAMPDAACRRRIGEVYGHYFLSDRASSPTSSFGFGKKKKSLKSSLTRKPSYYRQLKPNITRLCHSAESPVNASEEKYPLGRAVIRLLAGPSSWQELISRTRALLGVGELPDFNLTAFAIEPVPCQVGWTPCMQTSVYFNLRSELTSRFNHSLASLLTLNATLSGSAEQNWPTPDIVSSSSEWQSILSHIRSIQCIPTELFCDSKTDCPSGEDEEHCPWPHAGFEAIPRVDLESNQIETTLSNSDLASTHNETLATESDNRFKHHWSIIAVLFAFCAACGFLSVGLTLINRYREENKDGYKVFRFILQLPSMIRGLCKRSQQQQRRRRHATNLTASSDVGMSKLVVVGPNSPDPVTTSTVPKAGRINRIGRAVMTITGRNRQLEAVDKANQLLLSQTTHVGSVIDDSDVDDLPTTDRTLWLTDEDDRDDSLSSFEQLDDKITYTNNDHHHSLSSVTDKVDNDISSVAPQPLSYSSTRDGVLAIRKLEASPFLTRVKQMMSSSSRGNLPPIPGISVTPIEPLSSRIYRCSSSTSTNELSTPPYSRAHLTRHRKPVQSSTHLTALPQSHPMSLYFNDTCNNEQDTDGNHIWLPRDIKLTRSLADLGQNHQTIGMTSSAQTRAQSLLFRSHLQTCRSSERLSIGEIDSSNTHGHSESQQPKNMTKLTMTDNCITKSSGTRMKIAIPKRHDRDHKGGAPKRARYSTNYEMEDVQLQNRPNQDEHVDAASKRESYMLSTDHRKNEASLDNRYGSTIATGNENAFRRLSSPSFPNSAFVLPGSSATPQYVDQSNLRSCSTTIPTSVSVNDCTFGRILTSNTERQTVVARKLTNYQTIIQSFPQLMTNKNDVFKCPSSNSDSSFPHCDDHLYESELTSSFEESPSPPELSEVIYQTTNESTNPQWNMTGDRSSGALNLTNSFRLGQIRESDGVFRRQSKLNLISHSVLSIIDQNSNP